MCLAYWRQKVDGYYPAQSKPSYKVALRRLRAMYGQTSAATFGPLALQNIRQAMFDDGLCRTTINKRINLIREAFKWAVAQQLVPPAVYQALLAIEGLRTGRSQAKEAKPRQTSPRRQRGRCEALCIHGRKGSD